MSFSNDVKKELTKMKIDSKMERILELSSILKTNASISIRNALINISFSTESEDVAKKIYKLINKLYEYEPTISMTYNNTIMKEGIYTITVENEEVAKRILHDSVLDMYGGYLENTEIVLSRIKSKEKYIKAYLRGAFLGGGSIVDPEKNYHLEIVLTGKEDAEIVFECLNQLNIEALKTERKSKYIVYIKNSDLIADFLAVIGAQNSMLELENIRIVKQMRNDINRLVNCDTANINKTIMTAMKQIRYINIIEESPNCEMPENLMEIAKLRKEHPHESLKRIGELCDPPMSKSGVAHKLKKIKEIADKCKKNQLP